MKTLLSAVNWKKVQASAVSLIFSGVALFSLLTLLSWPADIVQAGNGRALQKTPAFPKPQAGRAMADNLPLSMLNSFETMDIIWQNYAIDFGADNLKTVTAIATGEDDTVWFGGTINAYAGGIALKHLDTHLDTWTTITLTGDLSGASEIRELVIDSSGNLWLATDKGAARRTPEGSWQVFTPQNSQIGNNDVRTVAVDENGSDIWFGTDGSGARRFSPGSNTWTIYSRSGSGSDQICSNTVYRVAVAADGAIWFGTDNGLCRLNMSDQWVYYLTEDVVYAIAFDAMSNVWVTRPGIGVSVLISESWTHYTPEDGLDNIWVGSIAVDSTERKWIGFNDAGLDLLSADNQEWRHFSSSDISGIFVNDIKEAGNGDIWVGVHHDSNNNENEVVARGVTAVSGVTAVNNSPIPPGHTATLTATSLYGSGVVYTWDFGDTSPEQTGAVVTHTYPVTGVYTAIVTASNSVSWVTATTTVIVGDHPADLAVDKTGPAESLAGSPVYYELSASNVGQVTATEVIITDTLPVGVTFITHTAPFPHTQDEMTHTISWEIGSLAPGAHVTFTLQVQVAITAEVGSVITNTLMGTTTEIELFTENNVANHATTILAPVMGVAPGSANLSVRREDTITTIVTVTNEGTAPLDNLLILPSHYDWVTIIPTSTPGLGINESFTFTIEAAPTGAQAFGHYLEKIWITGVAANNHYTLPVNLAVYVHPLLVDLDILVDNDLSNNVADAALLFTKSSYWVRYEEGTLVSEEVPILYNVTTGVHQCAGRS